MADEPPPPPPPPPPSLRNPNRRKQAHPRRAASPTGTSVTSRYYNDLYSCDRNAPSAPIEQQPRRESDVPSEESNKVARRDEARVDQRESDARRRTVFVARRDEARVDQRESDARRTVFGRGHKMVETSKRAKEATGGVHQREKDERERKILGRPRKLKPTDQEAKERAGVGQREQQHVKAKEVVQTDTIPEQTVTAASGRNTVSRGTQTSPERPPEKTRRRLVLNYSSDDSETN